MLRPAPPRPGPAPAPSGPCQAGFSLPEMMLVLAIILLLSTLAIPQFRHARERAEEAKATATLRDIHTAQEAYRITRGTYAPSFTALQNIGDEPLEVPGSEISNDTMVFQGYIYRLDRTALDAYTVTAEPVINRDSRPVFRMDHLGRINMAGGPGGMPGFGSYKTAPTGSQAGPKEEDEGQK